MSDKFGNLAGSCNEATSQLFTGIGRCGITEGNTRELIITDLKKEFEWEDFQTQIDTALTAAAANRAYILKGVIDNAFNGGDVATSQKGTYGGSAPSKLNDADHAFTIDAPDCTAQYLMGYNGKKVRIFRVDENGFPFGIKNDNGKFAGFEATIYVQYTPKAGDTAAALVLHVYYSSWEGDLKVKSNVEAVNLPDGLVPLTVKKVGDKKIKLVEACSGYDVTEMYADQIDETIFVDDKDGSPTSVTVSGGTITLVLASDATSVMVADASVLKPKGIIGYDGVKTLVEVAGA